MDGPPHKRKARPACHQNALTLTQSSAANNGANGAIAQFPVREERKLPAITQERFWHERAVEHQQRLLIIGLLASIDSKLELLLQQQSTKGEAIP